MTGFVVPRSHVPGGAAGSVARAVVALALVVVLPSLIARFALAWMDHADGPLADFDLLMVLGLATLGARWHASAAAWACAAAVVVLTGLQIANWALLLYLDGGSLAALASYIGFIGDWPWRTLVPLLAAAAAAVVGTHALVAKLELRRAAVWPPFAAAAVLAVLDLANGSTAATGGHTRVFPVNMLTSTSFATVSGLFDPHYAQWEAVPTDDAAHRVLQTAPPGRVLSIGVESFGVPRDPSAAAALNRAALAMAPPGYSVRMTTTTSGSGTLTGEFRALCGLRTSGQPRSGGDEFARCIPAVLRARGWRTVAVHGHSHAFYARDRIYPAMGFAHAYFRDDLGQASPPCPTRAPFTGWCDAVAMRFGLAKLGESPRAFVHVLTLDSHVPFTHSPFPGCTAGPVVCSYVAVMVESFGAIRTELARAPAPPDLVVIWGDHPPPFLSGAARDTFVPDRVPVIVLRRVTGAAGQAGVKR